MVTRIALDYIRSQPLPEGIEELGVDEILRERIEALQAKLPAWNGSPDSPGYKNQELEALREYALRQILNRNIRESHLPFATKSSLTSLAALAGVSRGDLDDEELIDKILNQREMHPGTRTGVIATAKLTPGVDVYDASALFAANNRSVIIYAAGPNHVDLSTADLVVIKRWMENSEHIILDVGVTVAGITRIETAIAVTLRYDRLLADPLTLAINAREAVYRWIDRETRLNNTIYVENLRSAVTIEGVSYASVQAPAADLDSAIDRVYTFPKTEANVVFTITAL